jgi:hypothetical protein
MSEQNNNKYKYFCNSCDYGTNLYSAYYKHLRTELHLTGKRKIRSDKKCLDEYVCNKCNHKSTSEHNDKIHYLNNHASIEEKRKEFKYFCETCNSGTFSLTEYKKHLERKTHKMKSS